MKKIFLMIKNIYLIINWYLKIMRDYILLFYLIVFVYLTKKERNNMKKMLKYMRFYKWQYI